MNVVFIEWSSSLSVGIPQMDREHQLWIGYINGLHDALYEGKATLVVGDVLRRVTEYTQTHFASEEALMKKYEYPSYELHRTLHEKFVRELSAMSLSVPPDHVLVRHLTPAQERSRYLSRLSLTLQASAKLKDWLVHHIENVDQQYGAFINLKRQSNLS